MDNSPDSDVQFLGIGVSNSQESQIVRTQKCRAGAHNTCKAGKRCVGGHVDTSADLDTEYLGIGMENSQEFYLSDLAGPDQKMTFCENRENIANLRI